ncbi:MAG: phospholipase D-like domain-containing protein [Candidatus Shapirobacteria bacterium]|nr:phospholipase D-like domain-containing protein [Candidatus Shapirobacteria bacterium]
MNNIIPYYLEKLFNLSPDLIYSKLYDDISFYPKFKEDLRHCKKEVIIESPFISSQRICTLIRPLESLVNRKVKVYIITRDPDEHDINMKRQAEEAIRRFERIGIQVIISSEYSHRKLAILDRKILWEGSLNILSQTYSQEIMRRINSEVQTKKCFNFINLGKYIY